MSNPLSKGEGVGNTFETDKKFRIKFEVGVLRGKCPEVRCGSTGKGLETECVT